MGRKGKFKPLMVSRAVREHIRQEFFARLSPKIKDWRSGQMLGHELVGIYWLELMKLWRPKDWQSGAFFRSCPARAHRGYEIWCKNPQLMVLRDSLPTPQELLSLQCEGKRVVSLVTDPDQFLLEVNGRDPLSFLLHDLVHAFEFFEDEEQMRAQINFYRRLQDELLANRELRDRLEKDSEFAQKFEYLISDMNSHPAHLEAYYQHITFSAVGRPLSRAAAPTV
jgi:hypothetical protein